MERRQNERIQMQIQQLATFSTVYKIEPIGPIASLVPTKYHRYLDNDTLKSYVAFNESDAQTFRKKSQPADIPIITKRKSGFIYPYIMKNLTEAGQEAIREIKDPNVVNVLIDWCSGFEHFICSDPLPDEQDDNGTGVELQEKKDTEQAVLLAQSQDDQGKWPKEAVVLLLDTYKSNMDKFNNPRVKKKTIWLKISDVLQSNGFNQNSTRCERKVLNVKSKYKTVKIHNSKSGNDPKSCSFYEELEDIFGKSPSIFPVSTCSSITTREIKESSNEVSTESLTVATPYASKDAMAKKRVLPIAESQHTASGSKVIRLESENKGKEPKLKKLKQTTDDKMLKAITELSEKEDKRMEKMVAMHTEQMNLTKSFIEVIQKAFASRDNNNNN